LPKTLKYIEGLVVSIKDDKIISRVGNSEREANQFRERKVYKPEEGLKEGKASVTLTDVQYGKLKSHQS